MSVDWPWIPDKVGMVPLAAWVDISLISQRLPDCVVVYCAHVVGGDISALAGVPHTSIFYLCIYICYIFYKSYYISLCRVSQTSPVFMTTRVHFLLHIRM